MDVQSGDIPDACSYVMARRHVLALMDWPVSMLWGGPRSELKLQIHPGGPAVEALACKVGSAEIQPAHFPDLAWQVHDEPPFTVLKWSALRPPPCDGGRSPGMVTYCATAMAAWASFTFCSSAAASFAGVRSIVTFLISPVNLKGV